MARIYDVVCLNCGAIMQWCKYDAPIKKCEVCDEKLTTEDDKKSIEVGAYEEGYPDWERGKVTVMGLASSRMSQIFSDRVDTPAAMIRKHFIRDD